METAGEIRRDTRVEVTLFVLNDVNKPNGSSHAIMITVMSTIKIPFSELTFSFARSSGSGGQNVNKVNSKVTMTWDPAVSEIHPDIIERFRKRYPQYVLDSGEIQIVSQEHRSQKSNIDSCVTKLHELLKSVERPPKARKATKPTRSSVVKRLTSKRKDSEKKRMRKGGYE